MSDNKANNRGAKPKKRVNLVDMLCLAVAAALLIGVYIRFSGGSEKVDAKQTEYYYEMQVNGVKQQAINQMQKSKGIPFQLDSRIPDDMGELISVAVVDFNVEITLADGSIVLAPYPERKSLLLTFRVNGSVTDEGFFTRDLNRINVGSWYTVRSKWVTVFGHVTKVWE